MTDERIKELMEQVGFPQSHSIAALIEQVANEVEQEVRAKLANSKSWDKISEVWEIGKND